MESKCIRDQQTNTEWLKRDFGDEVFDNISHNHIVCGGTLLGSVSAMIKLAKIMNDIHESHTQMWGLDQAALNYIVWENKLPDDIKILTSNVDGNIATIGDTDRNDIYISDIYINKNKPAVVHQYDRHSLLVGHVLINYTEKNKLVLKLIYSKIGQRVINIKDNIYLSYRNVMKPVEAKIKRWFR